MLPCHLDEMKLKVLCRFWKWIHKYTGKSTILSLNHKIKLFR